MIYKSALNVYAWLGPATADSKAFFRSLQDDNDLHNPYGADIAERAYLDRGWIVQELVLPDVVLFRCVDVVVAFDPLMNIFKLQPSSPEAAVQAATTRPLQSPTFLREQLTLFSRLKCTIEHDYIYALLKMSSDYQNAVS